MRASTLRGLLLLNLGCVVVCIAGILLSQLGLIPVRQTFFVVSLFGACVFALIAAVAYAALRYRPVDNARTEAAAGRGEPRWALPLAATTIGAILGSALFAAAVLALIVFLMATSTDD